MIKITREDDAVEFLMNEKGFDLALSIANYINENFGDSDFFTIKNASQEEVRVFINALQKAEKIESAYEIKLTLDRKNHWILYKLFSYASSLMDEEFSDEDMEAIENITDTIIPG